MRAASLLWFFVSSLSGCGSELGGHASAVADRDVRDGDMNDAPAIPDAKEVAPDDAHDSDDANERCADDVDSDVTERHSNFDEQS